MPRQGPSSWKDHCPWYIGDPAVEFSIDKVSDAAESEANGCRYDHEVSGLPEIDPHVPAEENACDEAADKTSVKGHAAMPNGENLKGFAEIGAWIVEDYVTEARTDEEPDDDIGVKGALKIARNGKSLFLDLKPHEEIGRSEPKEVHHSVPPHGEGANSYDLGTYRWIRDQVISLNQGRKD